ncbi:protein with a bacterial immunoglobulin-like domain protein [Legionella birminghamensis]|uniref:Protein with a bacterial immunoglobulin-like domain n=1 Tax=Legionella birminghamensis TaxID=28083 RepID=A0A378IBF6_9GAMM|nr:hypothetical protein [Legionella birminghamensis]KTC75158.1 protein with a bacterial immunoglobulin-like domain protein [Legionella birminghamensis]STX31891.1 protein with a bacterial immunoglobulin-like domain [Legionella birminghamensis]
MNKKKLCSAVIGIAPSQYAFAAIPKFGFSPLTPTTVQIPVNSSASISYLVRNNTSVPRLLTMQPINGVQQVVNGGTCGTPFFLNPGQSCVLSLIVNGSQVIPAGVHDGPVVCKTMGPGNNTPDPFLCSRPSQLDMLNVSVSSVPGQGNFRWTQNGVAVSSLEFYPGNSGAITLQNTGNGPISNLQVTIPAPYSSYFINGCVGSLAAASSCNVSYSIPVSPISASFNIAASGTNAVNSPLPLSIEISPSGRVQCWGLNSSGQLGDGSTTSSNMPSTFAVGITDAEEISGGSSYTCALLRTGAIQCWGSNFSGDLGWGQPGGSLVPVFVSGISTATTFSAGESHACAVLSNGTIQCWGANGAGQLGDGTTTNRFTPVTVLGITNAVAVSAGLDHTCAVLATGQVACWGSNAFGQLGDGTTNPHITPGLVPGITTASRVSLASLTSCVLLTNGTVQCWGTNGNGEVGNGSIGGNVLSPSTVVNLSNVIEISARGAHVSSLLSDGTVHCWGLNNVGQLGDGNSPISSGTPTQVQGLTAPAVDISSDLAHACAVLSTGEMMCWGINSVGQLGIGVTPVPPTVPPPAGLNLPWASPIAVPVVNMTQAMASLNHGSGSISCAIVP